jgi:hypothetical protein
MKICFGGLYCSELVKGNVLFSKGARAKEIPTIERILGFLFRSVSGVREVNFLTVLSL